MDHLQQEEAKQGDVLHKTRKQRAQESTETSGKQDVEYYPFPSASPPEKKYITIDDDPSAHACGIYLSRDNDTFPGTELTQCWLMIWG